MTDENLFKTLAIISPFAASGITYLLTLRSKKNEYLYQNRLPAFKEVAASIVKIRKYCEGRLAMQRGFEFYPYYEESAGSALTLRADLADSRAMNEIFLSDKSKNIISSVDSQLGILCNVELSVSAVATDEERENLTGDAYDVMFDVVERALTDLYKEIGLPSK